MVNSESMSTVKVISNIRRGTMKQQQYIVMLESCDKY